MDITGTLANIRDRSFLTTLFNISMSSLSSMYTPSPSYIYFSLKPLSIFHIPYILLYILLFIYCSFFFFFWIRGGFFLLLLLFSVLYSQDIEQCLEHTWYSVNSHIHSFFNQESIYWISLMLQTLLNSIH